MTDRVPGIMKNTAPKIPPDFAWDPEHPQIVYNCTNEIFHAPQCDKQCGSYEATEGLTNLLNEQRRWARLSINPNVNIDPLSIICRLEMVEGLLREQHGITEEEWDEQFRLYKADKMRVMREQVEPQILAAKKEGLVAAKPSIISPHGERLN